MYLKKQQKLQNISGNAFIKMKLDLEKEMKKKKSETFFKK